ncbi:MAG: hypothetical protein KF861_20690 [Planctomycetaceae bacterium]|nr:hypothetical protein [Planctomycetaceae bacterium]
MTDAADVGDLLARFHVQDRHALNRLVSLATRGESLDVISAALGDQPVPTRLIAFTGNSGVGKSSLLARLIALIRNRGETVAVLACDPESALTGGALLGDRIRMASHAGDAGVWIRSLSTTSGEQAIAAHLDVAAQLLGRFGFNHILLETVGAGQGDVAVEALADVVVLLIQPEIGDELQWEKAGVLEVADIVVVHKGDLPGAERTESQARELLNLPGARGTPVIRVSSKTGSGLNELWDAILACPGHREVSGRNRRTLLRLIQESVADAYTAQSERITPIIEAWSSGRQTSDVAVRQVLAVLANGLRADGNDAPSEAR